MKKAVFAFAPTIVLAGHLHAQETRSDHAFSLNAAVASDYRYRGIPHLFGLADSRGSGCLDLEANIDLGSGLTLSAHAWRQQVRSNGQAN
jgi:hypothetical protein